MQLDFHLIVVESEGDTEKVIEPFDVVVAGEHGIKLIEVIEDELLGSLPIAPMHEDAKECDPAASQHLMADPEHPEETELNKPFADLADLMKGADAANTKN